MEQLVEQANIDSTLANRTKTPTIELLTVEKLLELPPPNWLIEDIIEEGAFAVLYGPSGEGKTFVALDWSLCIAANRKWHGRFVTSGPVVYVVAEGGRNIGSRIAAWMQEHEIDDLKSMFAVLRAVEITNREHLTDLQRAIEDHEIRPSLIVIDTLARCFGGGDENSAKDMGLFVRACDHLREVTGATVLAVHHTGKGINPTERGSSALRGAADAMIQVYRKDRGIFVEVDKQKDAELINPIRLRLQSVTIQKRHSEQTHRSTSAVLVGSDDQVDVGPRVGAGSLALLKALVVNEAQVAESSKWRGGLSESTFHRRRRELMERGLVEPEGLPHTYRATELGIATAKGLPLVLQQQRPDAAATATPLEGVAGGSGEALRKVNSSVVISEADDNNGGNVQDGSTRSEHSQRPTNAIEG